MKYIKLIVLIGIVLFYTSCTSIDPDQNHVEKRCVDIVKSFDLFEGKTISCEYVL